MTQIHWRSQISDVFSHGSDWTGGSVPGAGDDAILDASGTMAYTVTTANNRTVLSLQTNALATLAITGGTFTALTGTGGGKNRGTIAVGDGATFTAGGTLDNAKGTISLNSAGLSTRLIVVAGGLTLTGGGHVTLGDSVSNRIAGASSSATLTNVDNIISGAGQLGGAQMTLINEASGVIQAVGTNALVLNTKGEAVINDGLLEAAGRGGLTIQNTTVDDSGGGIVQADSGSQVNLRGAVIVGGTLTTKGNGSIRVPDGMSVLDGLNNLPVIVTARALTVADGAALTIEGTIDLFNPFGTISSEGKLVVASTGDATRLIVSAAGAHLSGGTVKLTDNAANSIEGDGSVPTLTDGSTTIVGAGTIGANLSIVNFGVIDAEGVNGLTLTPGNAGVQGSDTILNVGTLEATNNAKLANPGGLTLYGVINNYDTGIIKAGNGSVVNLGSGCDIVGGTITTYGSGAVNIRSFGFHFLDGRTYEIANQGIINVAAPLVAGGAIRNSGSITLEQNGSLFVNPNPFGSGLTLTGGGAIVLENGSYIEGYHNALTNVDNTISGNGYLCKAVMTLVNETNGVVVASGNRNSIVFSPGDGYSNAATVVNSGLIQASNGGIIGFDNAVVLGTRGEINIDITSKVEMVNSTISGGQITNFGRIDCSNAAILDINLENSGLIAVGAGMSLEASGTISNTQAIYLNGAVAGKSTLLVGRDNLTLVGSGNVFLSDSVRNYIRGTALGTTITNMSNEISGAGFIGYDDNLTLINGVNGTIDGNGSDSSLYLATGVNTITNAGLIEGTSFYGADVESAIVNTGILEANGGNLRVERAVTGSGKGVVNAGTLEFFAANLAQTIAFVGATGTLRLDQSQSFTGKVTGFSTTSGTSFDLSDVAFTGSGEATYAGNKSGGTLTVTDGTHTAHIKLVGNYIGSTFVASGDGHGGVTIVDTKGGPTTPPPHTFIAAVAAFAPIRAGPVQTAMEMRSFTAFSMGSPRAHLV